MSANEAAGTATEPAKARKIKLYDFKRPDKFSKEQVRTLQFMHEAFARLTNVSLSAGLRTLVHVHVAAVDQLTYEEFLRSIPSPCTLAVIHMDPLTGSALLEIDPAISGAILDRALGGDGAPSGGSGELTQAECAAIEILLIRVLGNLRESWSNVTSLRPRLGALESHPQYCQIVPPTEMCVLVSIETKVADAEGMMNLCIPYLTLQSVVPKLSPRYYFSPVRQRTGPGPTPAGLPLAAEVCFAGRPLSLRELGALRPGSEVDLPGFESDEFILRAGGVDVVSLSTSQRGRKGPELVVRAAAAEDRAWIEGSPKPDHSVADELRAALAEPLEELGDGLRKSVEDLRGRIASLSDRQNQLADQLLLTSGEEAPVAEQTPERPFSFLGTEHADALAGVLQKENLQAVALILSFFDPPVVCQVLASLEDGVQVEVVRRIARLQSVAPNVISGVEATVRARLTQAGAASLLSGGGVEMAAEILATANRSVERAVMEGLERTDGELAEELKRRMFVFEDVVLLDADAIRSVYAAAGQRAFAVALKGTSQQVADHVQESLEASDREALQADSNDLGRVRLRDVEEAQQRIVGVIRELEDAGALVVGPPEAVVE